MTGGIVVIEQQCRCMAKNKPKSVSLVLGSGGARGFAQLLDRAVEGR